MDIENLASSAAVIIAAFLVFWLLIPILIKQKITPITKAIRRNKQKPSHFKYDVLFNEMSNPEEIRNWIKKDIPGYFGEWPRDSAGFFTMVSSLRTCKFSHDLEEDANSLKWLWYNADKTSKTIENYDAPE